jgi:hypothetical protein
MVDVAMQRLNHIFGTIQWGGIVLGGCDYSSIPVILDIAGSHILIKHGWLDNPPFLHEIFPCYKIDFSGMFNGNV